MNKLKNIVVGVDYSTRSKSALIKAARLARQNQAQLHVIHVIEREHAEDLASHERRSLDEIRKELTASANAMMTKWSDGIDLPPDTDRSVAYGHPVEELGCVRKPFNTTSHRWRP
ncbi:MAG: universal stress protein, partial [Limisphaerales bacterium]